MFVYPKYKSMENYTQFIADCFKLIEYERISNKQTVAALSAKADITPDFYYKCVQGVKTPSFPVLWMLLKAVGLSLAVTIEMNQYK